MSATDAMPAEIAPSELTVSRGVQDPLALKVQKAQEALHAP